jgi:hypothetical protein
LLLDFRSGSKVDMAIIQRDVRFTLENGHRVGRHKPFAKPMLSH